MKKRLTVEEPMQCTVCGRTELPLTFVAPRVIGQIRCQEHLALNYTPALYEDVRRDWERICRRRTGNVEVAVETMLCLVASDRALAAILGATSAPNAPFGVAHQEGQA